VYANGKFVFGGSSGRLLYNPSNPPASGSWVQIPGGDSTFQGYINGIAYGAGVFVAVGGYDTSTPANGGHTAWSPDGITWTGVNTSPLLNNSADDWLNGVAFGSGKFVSVGGLDAGTGKALYSTDGKNWSASGPLGFTNGYKANAVAAGGGLFVAVSGSGQAAWSRDGVTWTATAATTFGAGEYINGITYGNGRFLIVGINGKAAYAMVE
jgi:hypothetical protein